MSLANTSLLIADASQASIAEHKALWWQNEIPNYLQWSVDVGAIETTYTNSTTANTLSRATGVKNAGVTYASTVGTAIQTYETTTATARAQYLTSVMSSGETAAEAKLKAGRDKEIALANADLQKQLTGNESAYATAVNQANSAYDTATTDADAVLKSAKQTSLSQLNTALAQSSKDKDTAIAGAERTYDQLVAALDAQYGSSSSNGDTGIEGARRDASISTRDAQYYASRDTSWAGTLSGSATIGNTPWTLKAIAAANAQAAYSTNRARAQAAHDAALLSAMNDWRESSSAAYLKSLVSSSRAENDFKSSVAGFWADWNMATEGNDRGAPTGFHGSVTDSVMGLMNPFDTDSIARSLTTETKADTTNGPQRPKPSDIHVVYSIYGIVSEHTPEEWEVIREYQTKGRTWEEWMMGGERKRMDAAGFKTSFRKLEEDVPPAKVLPTPSPPSPAPVTPVLSNPILTPLDANNELMVSRDDFDLDITDTILGIIGGTRGDYIDESFNFLYGVGDNMSLGVGWWLRSTFFHDQADYGGSSYYIGGWVGFAGDLLMGVGAFKALGKTFGREALESGLRNAPSSGGGGFGVLGRMTEGAYPLNAQTQAALRSEILTVAKSRQFLQDAGLAGKANRAARREFWDLLRQAEVAGSNKGGAAGLLRYAGESEHALRIAIKPSGRFLGLSRNTMIRHELAHFAREASSLSKNGVSLFQLERSLKPWDYRLYTLGLKEEVVAWRITFGW